MNTIAKIGRCLRDIFQLSDINTILKLAGGINHADGIQFVAIRAKNKTITNT